MKKLLLAFLSCIPLIHLGGCSFESRGFSLPEGDIAAGKETYQQLQCHACHEIAGIEQLATNGQSPISVKLGGTVTRIKTYGELVTSVINPSHRIAAQYATQSKVSPMRNYNDVMTVQELVDVVTFLRSEYVLTDYPATHYGRYYP